jgi:C-terminal processing protease CtpA/Prc
VVLVNRKFVSGAEILAGPLRDYDRSETVSETAFGTGPVLDEYVLIAACTVIDLCVPSMYSSCQESFLPKL